MFFLVTREGRPLRKRRYIFSETFTIAALAAYGRAAGDAAAVQQAVALYEQTLATWKHPGLLPPKWTPETSAHEGAGRPHDHDRHRPDLARGRGRSHQVPAVDRLLHRRDRARFHEARNSSTVLETVGPNGEFIDHFDGRTLNPGPRHRGGLVHPA